MELDKVSFISADTCTSPTPILRLRQLSIHMFIVFLKTKASNYLLMPKVNIPLSGVFSVLNPNIHVLSLFFFIHFLSLSTVALFFLHQSTSPLLYHFFSSCCVPTVWHPACPHLFSPSALNLQLHHWSLALRCFQKQFSGSSPLIGIQVSALPCSNKASSFPQLHKHEG